MSQRIAMVQVGSVKVGDELHGLTVTGFGQAWTLPNEDNCTVGAAPWESVRVCYAYGERVDRAAPVAPEAPKPAPPAYGSREWKVARLAALPALIDESEWTASVNARSADRNKRAIGERAAASAANLRAQLEQLQAELAE